MKTFLKIFGILVVMAVIVLIGYYVFKSPQTAVAPADNSQSGAQASDESADSSGVKYTDSMHGFSFSHAAVLAVAKSPAGTTFDTPWRTNTQTLGLLFVTGTITKSTQPKTNFSEAKLTVGESNAFDAISSCATPQNGEIANGPVMINGVSFAKFTMGDAGAGNYYDTTSYRTVHNGRCFAIEYAIHSTSLGAYDPSQGISQFDKAKVIAPLEGAVQSFKFLATTGDLTSFLGTWTGVEGTSVAISKNSTGFDLKFVTLDGKVSATGKANGDAISFTRDSKSFVMFHGTGDDTGMKDFLGTGKTNCIVVAPYEGYCKS